MIAATKSRLSLAVAVGAITLVPGVALAAAKPTPPATTATTATATTGKATKKTTRKKSTPSKQTTTSKTTTSSKLTAPLGATDKRCWNDLIRDWYDGRIDRTYPVHCYQDALKHLPQDVKTYSDAYDVISRALADATRDKKKVNPNAPVQPPDTGKRRVTSPFGGPSSGGGGGGSPSAGPIGTGLNAGDRGATGIPLPLLILGGLALLLVAAGGAGFLVRRYQSRGGPGPS